MGLGPGASWRFPRSHLADALLATELNGRPLTKDHGYPCRLVIPGWPQQRRRLARAPFGIQRRRRRGLRCDISKKTSNHVTKDGKSR